MFLKEAKSGHLVEVLGLADLFDPFRAAIVGRYHFGEEMQEPDSFAKAELTFCSNEGLPDCWTDPNYRDHELRRTGTGG